MNTGIWRSGHSCRVVGWLPSVVLAAGSIMPLAAARAQSVESHWSSATSGSWTVGNFWSTAPTVPNNSGPTGYTALVDALGPAYTVSLNANIVLDRLVIASPTALVNQTSGTLTAPIIDLNAGSLYLTSTSPSVATTINAAPGTSLRLSGGFGPLTLNGNFGTQANPATMGGTYSTLTLNGTAVPNVVTNFSFSGTAPSIGAGTFSFMTDSQGRYSSLIIQDSQTLTLGAGTILNGPSYVAGTFTSNSPFTGTIVNNGLVGANAPGLVQMRVASFLNNGTIRATNSGTINVGNLTGNGGAIVANGGLVRILSGTYTVGSAVQVSNGGVIELGGNWTNSGGLSVGAGGSLLLGGNFNAAAMGAITNSGGSISLSGNYDNTGATLTFGPSNVPFTVGRGGRITGGTIVSTGGGVLVVAQNQSSNTATPVLDGVDIRAPINVTTSQLVLAGNWHASAMITAPAEALRLSGTFTAADVQHISTPSLIFSGLLNNTGNTLTMSPAQTIWASDNGTINGGIIQFAPGGLLRAPNTPSGTVSLTLNDVTTRGVMQYTNFQSPPPHLVTNNLHNEGTLDLGGSNLTLNGSWSNTGLITNVGTLTAGGTYNASQVLSMVSAGTTLVVAGAFDNTGFTVTLGAPGLMRLQSGGSITGGTIRTVNGQSNTLPVSILGSGLSATLNGVDLQVPLTGGAASTGYTGAMINIIGNSNLSAGLTTYLTDVTLGGTSTAAGLIQARLGRLTFAGSPTLATGRLNFGDGSSARLLRGQTLTLGAAFVVDGGSPVALLDTDSAPSGVATIINQGRVTANVAGQTLRIAPDVFINQGTLESISGGSLVINGLTSLGPTISLAGAGSSLTLNGNYVFDHPFTVPTGTTLVLGGQPNITSAITVNGGVLSLNDSWSANAPISVNNGTVNLGGIFNPAALAGIAVSGTSTVAISGTVANTGSTYTVNSAANNLPFNGGSIVGGTANFLNGQRLRVGAAGATLDGVALNGDIDLPSGILTVRPGTSFNGTATVGTGTMLFSGSQSVNGLTVNFNSPQGGLIRVADGALPVTLTLGPTTYVHGGRGLLGAASNLADNDTIINQGRISADQPNQTIGIQSSAFTNTGIIEALNGGFLYVNNATGSMGTVRTDGANSQIQILGGNYVLDQVTTVGPGSFLDLRGTWSATAPIQVQGGTLRLAGSLTQSVLSNVAYTSGAVELRGFSNFAGQNFVSGAFPVSIVASDTTAGRLDAASVTIPAGGSVGIAQSATLRTNQILGLGTLSLNSSSRVQPADSLVDPNGGSLLIGTGVTVTGSGAIGRTASDRTDLLVNSGLIDLAANNTLNVSARTFQNTGTIRVRGGTFTTFSDWSNAGTIELSAGTFALGGRFTTASIGNLQMTGGSLVLSGEWNNAGQSLIVGPGGVPASLTGSGSLLGGDITFSSPQATVSGNTVLGGGATAHGSLLATAMVISGGLTMDGQITVPANGDLTFRGGQTISAPSIVLQSNSSELLLQTGTTILGSSSVVTGPGSVGPASSAGDALLVNQGRFAVSGLGQELGIRAPIVNSGVMEALDGARIFFYASSNPSVLSSSLGVLRASGGSTISVARSLGIGSGTIQLQNSTFELVSNGELDATGSTVTFTGDAGSQIFLGGTLRGGRFDFSQPIDLNFSGLGNTLTLANTQINGTILTGSTRGIALAGQVSGTNLIRVQYDAQMTSTGVGDSFNGSVSYEGSGTSMRRFYITGPLGTDGRSSGSLTLGANSVIRGGRVTFLGSSGRGESLANAGRISADTFGQTIVISPPTFTNTGVLEAINGGRLEIGLRYPLLFDSQFTDQRSWSNTGTIRVGLFGELSLGGQYNSSSLAGIVRTDPTSIVRLSGAIENQRSVINLPGGVGEWVLAGAVIRGGTVNIGGSATLSAGLSSFANEFDGVTINGNMTMPVVNNSLNFRNDNTLNGTLTVTAPGPGAITFFGVNPTLTGGTLYFNPPVESSFQISLNSAAGVGDVTFSPTTFIHGAGASIAGNFVNRGTITADISGRALGINARRFANYGTVGSANGGVLSINEGPLPPADGSAGSAPPPAMIENLATMYVTTGSRLRIEADFTQYSDGLLSLEIGPGDVNQIDPLFSVDGTARLGGTLQVTAAPAAVWTPGQSFRLLAFSGVQGGFDSILLPSLSGGLWWDSSDLVGGGVIRVVPAPSAAAGMALATLALRRRRSAAGAQGVGR